MPVLLNQKSLFLCYNFSLYFYKQVGSSNMLTEVCSATDVCGATLKLHFKNRKKIYMRKKLGTIELNYKYFPIIALKTPQEIDFDRTIGFRLFPQSLRSVIEGRSRLTNNRANRIGFHFVR